MEDFFTQIARAVVSGLMMGMVFGLVALGLTIIFGVMDIVNFAHGEFLMIRHVLRLAYRHRTAC